MALKLIQVNRMPHHVTPQDSWRPNDLVESFRFFGIQSELNVDRVSALIPILEWNLDKFLAATSAEERAPKKLGETIAILSFDSERLIDNIFIEFDIEVLMSRESYPDFRCLEKALEKCGYVSGSALELVHWYLPNDTYAFELVDEIELLDVRKENLLAQKDFEGAAEVRQKNEALWTQLEDRIRNRNTTD